MGRHGGCRGEEREGVFGVGTKEWRTEGSWDRGTSG